MCDSHLADGPLACVRTDIHLTGHVYESTSAGDAEPGGGDQ